MVNLEVKTGWGQQNSENYQWAKHVKQKKLGGTNAHKMSPDIQHASQWQVPMFRKSLVIRIPMTEPSVPRWVKKPSFLRKIVVSNSIATFIIKTTLRLSVRTIRMFSHHLSYVHYFPRMPGDSNMIHSTDFLSPHWFTVACLHLFSSQVGVGVIMFSLFICKNELVKRGIN